MNNNLTQEYCNMIGLKSRDVGSSRTLSMRVRKLWRNTHWSCTRKVIFSEIDLKVYTAPICDIYWEMVSYALLHRFLISIIYQVKLKSKIQMQMFCIYTCLHIICTHPGYVVHIPGGATVAKCQQQQHVCIDWYR